VPSSPNVLLCWELIETNSWNPVLAGLLRQAGLRVTEIHDVGSFTALHPSDFDICLPRFRVGAAHMTCLDEALVASGIPMLNSRDSRRRCENKILAHQAFERHGITQPLSFALSADGVADRALQWRGETIVKRCTEIAARESRSAARCRRRSGALASAARISCCSR
jgi:glutathione synthase/RimK-type ligase-like ATP-grasp enzyme